MDLRLDWPPGRTQRAVQAPPCAMVIFGSSGDLTKRLLIPALYNLAKAGRLSDKFALIGVDRTDRSHEEFRAYLAEGVRSFVSDTGTGPVTAPFDARAWEFLAARMTHLKGDVTDPAMYDQLGQALKEIEAAHGTAGNVVFYLAVAASLFAPVVERLAAAGLTREEDQHWRRVIIEKPFGHDLESARELDARLAKVLSEDQIYRMDHFLGKETVQNIMVLRFANGIFEPLWNRDHIDHVQITVAETVGVERRAAFYEETGALRDMVPNHVFQLLSLTAMEPPNSFAADAVRTEKDKVLEAVIPLDDNDVRRNVVRGQYTAGVVRGVPIKAYREEEGVAPDSMTETYVALRLGIDNWRWAGVPFYIRTGKRLARKVTEIAVTLKPVPHLAFSQDGSLGVQPNQLVLTLQPNEGVSLRLGAKIPGTRMIIRPVNMEFLYGTAFLSQSPEAYERLITDAMRGDATLFTRNDEVEAQWRICDPIVGAWATQPGPLAQYEAGSQGPKEADELLLEGHHWRAI